MLTQFSKNIHNLCVFINISLLHLIDATINCYNCCFNFGFNLKCSLTTEEDQKGLEIFRSSEWVCECRNDGCFHSTQAVRGIAFRSIDGVAIANGDLLVFNALSG